MNNEVKPIVVIKYNDDRIAWTRANQPDWREMNDLFIRVFGDKYITFAFPENCKDLFEFQVFYPKDFTEIQYEELKEMIKSALEKVTNK